MKLKLWKIASRSRKKTTSYLKADALLNLSRGMRIRRGMFWGACDEGYLRTSETERA
jgi:hypothetical protein